MQRAVATRIIHLERFLIPKLQSTNFQIKTSKIYSVENENSIFGFSSKSENVDNYIDELSASSVISLMCGKCAIANHSTF